MHRGYIKVWRKLEDSGLFQIPNTLALFMFLLSKAVYKDCKVGTPYGVVHLKRGQYIAGRISLASDLNQSERQIRTSLSRLKELEIIDQQPHSRFSIYTIVNYNNYQDRDQQATSTTTSSRPADDQQTTTKEEGKELKALKELTPMSGKPNNAPLKSSPKIHGADSIEVLGYLNQKTNSAFRTVDANMNLIKARLKEGATIEEMKRVIDVKAAEWMTNDKMKEFLRPATLFNAEKYAQYFGQVEVKAQKPVRGLVV